MAEIANTNLALLITAQKAAQELNGINLADYALKNPLKWDSLFLKAVLEQYQFREKLIKKLPEWYKANVIGAGSKAIEQCSSELTGKHKFKDFSGHLALDLTGGFGVDSYHLALNFDQVISCEANHNLQEIVKYNFKKLGINNVTFVNQKAEDFLKDNSKKFDLIYLDPDRRNDANKKLVLLEHCSPNIINIQENLLHLAKQVLIKYSPLLDIPLALSQIQNVEKVEIVALKNEVKELLFTLTENPPTKAVQIISTNIKKGRIQEFSHTIAEEKLVLSSYSLPLNFLYEPNAAILKSGAFKQVGEIYGVQKLAQHSHYYTSVKLEEDFPGKAFQIDEVLAYNSKSLRPFKNAPVNVLARNFPIKTETIRQKHRLKNGGDHYLIFTKNHKNEKIILSCRRKF